MTNLFNNAMIGVYGGLLTLAVVCAKRFTKTTILAHFHNNLDVKKHAFVIAFTLISIWGVVETIIYGSGRVIPDLYPYVSMLLPLVISAKLLGLVGFCFAYYGLKSINDPNATLKEPFILAIRAWAFTFIALSLFELIIDL